MTNEQIKAKIESAASVKIVIASGKCDGHEGYADAYAVDCPSYFYKGKTRYKGKAIASAASYGCRTRMDATSKAMLKLAAALGVTIDADPCQGRADADFAARTV